MSLASAARSSSSPASSVTSAWPSLLILFVSATYGGCAVGVPGARPAAAPADELRVRVADPLERAAIVHVESSLPFAPAGLFARRREDDAGCLHFTLDPRAAFPDGAAVEPADVVVAWEAGLGAARSAHGFLLEPVAGSAAVRLGASEHARGLRADDGELVVCFDRPVPDLGERLDHPGLWLDPRGGGPGPFRWDGHGTLEANPHGGVRAARLPRVTLVATADDPARLFERGAIDLAVIYGREVAELAGALAPRVRMERAPGWDKTYALWLAPRGRWLADPAFRRWVAAALDAESMLRLLFGGRGEVSRGLATPRARRLPSAPPRRPFGPGSAPVLDLAYCAGDRDADRLAARIKAVLEGQGVGVRLVPEPNAVEAGRHPAVILAHHQVVRDPLLTLADTLWPLGEAASAPLERLARAARLAGPPRRLRAAREIEDDLVGDGRLVPLFRLEAWWVAASRVRADRPGLWGRLGLDSARWRR